MESSKVVSLKLDLLKETPKYLIRRCRKRFNRAHKTFQSSAVVGEANIATDEDLAAQFSLKDKLNRTVQWNTLLSEHEVCVDKISVESCGVNHVEGGWPKDISYLDLEQTMRFRKKTEKDELYMQDILHLGNIVEHGIQQNNALNVYRDYFPNLQTSTGDDVCTESMRILTLLRDPSACCRPVTGISWSSNKKLAVAHSIAGHSSTSIVTGYASNDSFIWDIGNCIVVESNLKGPSCPVCIEFNPKDSNAVVAGCSSGQVVYWDVRRAPSFVGASNVEVGHKDYVKSVLWLNSKTGTEFFSAGIDGQVCWWDIRKICQPVDSLILDPTRGIESQMAQVPGATCLEFEPTMSTKFMVGTELGTVFLCNSKAKSIQEKLAQMYTAHLGQVQTLQRNPMFIKNFLTIGDWTAKIWSEDVRESFIFSTGYRMTHLTAGCWSPTRPSVFLTASVEGTLQLWDLLVDQNEPVIQLKVNDQHLSSLRIHENGTLVACGATNGTLAVVKLPEDAAMLSKMDKSLLTAFFERETKRERILEARSREQRLRDKIQVGEEAQQEELCIDTCERCSLVEKQFWSNMEIGEGETSN